jgi:hypothetical protein
MVHKAQTDARLAKNDGRLDTFCSRIFPDTDPTGACRTRETELRGLKSKSNGATGKHFVISSILALFARRMSGSGRVRRPTVLASANTDWRKLQLVGEEGRFKKKTA